MTEKVIKLVRDYVEAHLDRVAVETDKPVR